MAVMSARTDLPIHASCSPRHCHASVAVADGENDDLADDVWRGANFDAWAVISLRLASTDRLFVPN
jgi:hypothetical protein